MDREEMSNLYRGPTKFRFIWESGFRGEYIQKSTIQKQESPVAAMFVNGSGRNEQSLQRTFNRCFLPRFGSFRQAVSEKIFLEIDQSETRIAYDKPCLLPYQDEISNLQRTFHKCFQPSFGSFCQAVSEKKDFLEINQSEQELPEAAMFVNGSGRNGQSIQRISHKCFLPSFGSFGQTVSEKILQKMTNQKQELLVFAMFVNGSGRNEQFL